MSDTNNPTPPAGEPAVPPTTPPVPPAPSYTAPPSYPQQPPAPAYQQPPAPAYQQPPAPAQGYPQAPPPGYQPPQQPYYGGYPQSPAAPPTNTLAIITIILAFVFSIAGIVTGHIALKQIDRTGESGRGLAKAGLILSYVFTGLGLLIVIGYFVIIGLVIATAGTSGYYNY